MLAISYMESSCKKTIKVKKKTNKQTKSVMVNWPTKKSTLLLWFITYILRKKRKRIKRPCHIKHIGHVKTYLTLVCVEIESTHHAHILSVCNVR